MPDRPRLGPGSLPERGECACLCVTEEGRCIVGSAVCCMVSARGLAARVPPACTEPVLCAHRRGLHFSSEPGARCSPTPPF